MILSRAQLCCGVLFALLAARTANASDGCKEYLYPGDTEGGEIGGYVAHVRKTLADDASVAASMVVMPSFKPEYAVAIARDARSGERWVARYGIVGEQMWGNESGKAPRVDATEIPLDAPLALRIVDTWQRVIDSVQAPAARPAIVDGVTFVFSVGGHRVETLSPECGLPALATQSGQALREAASARTPAAREAALQRLSALLDAIAQDLPGRRS